MAGILTHEQSPARVPTSSSRVAARRHRAGDRLHRAQVGLVRDGQFATGVPDRWWPRPGCLTIAEREEILVGIHFSSASTPATRCP